MTRHRGFRRRPRNWPLVIGIVLALTGVGVWVWPSLSSRFLSQQNMNENTNAATNTNTASGNENVNTKQSNTNSNLGNGNVNTATNFSNTNTVPLSTATEIVHGATDRKVVAFTFDAGAGTQSLQPILDALTQAKVDGTFFMTGTWATKNPTLVKQIVDAGFPIYNHTETHPHLPTLTDQQIIDELSQAETAIKTVSGKTTLPFFRAPYGDRDARVLRIAAAQGYQSVYWTTDALDWEESTGMTATKVHDRILANVKPGAIFLMHVGDTLTGTVLPTVLSEIKKQGYAIESLDSSLR